MLAIVHNQVVEIEPVVSTGDGFSIEVAPPSSRGLGRIYVKYDGRLVSSGIRFHRVGGDDCQVNPIDGEYRIEKGFKSTIRVILGNEHRDVEIEG